MKMKIVAAALVAGGLSFALSDAQAAECGIGKAGGELTGEEALSIYDCLKDELQEGYQTGDKRWIPSEFVNDYPSWTAASTIPAAPGFHGGRFLVTYVNETGADAYLKYDSGEVNIPAGTVIAKESFTVTDSGKVEKGPLFIMEKVAAGTSEKTMDWYYMAVAPNGSPMAVNVFKACNECHVENFGHTGGLGFPAPEARVGN